MICSQVDSFPHSSTAVHTLVIVPAKPPHSVKTPSLTSWNVIVIDSAKVQLSVATVNPVLSGSKESSQLTVMFVAQVKTASVISCMVII